MCISSRNTHSIFVNIEILFIIIVMIVFWIVDIANLVPSKTLHWQAQFFGIPFQSF